ncbi:FUSC family protein [Streptomyces sp. NBC_00820]|uniref:FUSC family protein n=1 Tax=Streptomyces sp. NBC_00820 TaxID=2975842 RepID=UPI003FA7C396
MRALSRAVRVGLWDRIAASDPGLLRLTAGMRNMFSVALTLGVLAALQVPVPQLVAGAMTAMAATFAIREKHPAAQAVTLALSVPVAFASISLGALLNRWPVASDMCFVLIIFGAVYSRRFGERGTALGVIVFQIYFVALFVGATIPSLPALSLVIAVAFGCSALARFVLLPQTPAGTLDRLRRAFRARLGQLIAIQAELLDAEPEDVDKVLKDLRTSTARLHETALEIQGRLDYSVPDPAVARLLERRIADAEIAGERLGLMLLTARSAERTNTLTLHLPGAHLKIGEMPVREEARTKLRRDLEALRLLVLRPAGEASGTALAQVRNRLLGYREEGNLPKASPPVQDVFRGLGEATRAVLGLRTALEGAQDESDDSPETARSREELDAENAAIEGSEETEPEPAGLQRLTTRSAVQVAVGSALAIGAGELLSSRRWYWAVLTCWIVFVNTVSTGEILVKGYRRVLGTVLGVVAGVGLAGLVGHHTWTAFALVLVCIFAMFYTAPLSYTLLSFFVTAALGLLYTLLNTYSMAVLLLRVEETVLGAVCGVLAAVLVLPVDTDRHTNELLADVLDKLADVTRAAVDQLSGTPHTDLVDKARDLDQALADLRAATQPLTHPITPMRTRRDTVRYLVALLETCAYHARALAATAELLPSNPSIAADPRLRGVCRRILHNIEAIAAHVRDPHSTAELETGPSIASMLEPGTLGSPRYGRVTDRVLRHLQRLDEAVSGLARPLGISVARPEKAKERAEVKQVT